MNPFLSLCVALAAAVTFLCGAARAAEPASAAVAGAVNTVCPVSGQPANPAITVVYEGTTYAFANAECRAKFNAAREASLYHRLGGRAALDAAVEAFYVRVLADARIKHFFEDINMTKQRRKQKEFLAAAFGAPTPWTGKDMRRAHANLGLKEEHFNAVAENLQKTLEDLKIKKELIQEVMAIAASTRDSVLNRGPAAAR